MLFSPVHGELDPKLLSEWVIADRLDVRVQLQVHKYIWSPDDAWRLSREPGAVVLLSGGLDSYTAAAVAKRDGFSRFSAQHQLRPAARAELEASRAVARALGRRSGISSSIST